VRWTDTKCDVADHRRFWIRPTAWWYVLNIDVVLCKLICRLKGDCWLLIRYIFYVDYYNNHRTGNTNVIVYGVVIISMTIAWVCSFHVTRCHMAAEFRPNQSVGIYAATIMGTRTFQKWYGSGWKMSSAGARIEPPKSPSIERQGRGSGGASRAPPAGSGSEPWPPTHFQHILGPQNGECCWWRKKFD